MNSEESLSIAHDLVDQGIPVIRAKLGKIGEPIRSGWEKIRPDHNEVDSWKSGMGLLIAAGHGYDVIDIDPRNGGDESWERLKSEIRIPKIYRCTFTRSGGKHLWIASLGIPKGDIPGFPGIDFQGKGSLVFIPPTVRRTKHDPEPVGYEYWRGSYSRNGHDSSGKALAALIRKPERPVTNSGEESDDGLDVAYLMSHGFTEGQGNKIRSQVSMWAANKGLKEKDAVAIWMAIAKSTPNFRVDHSHESRLFKGDMKTAFGTKQAEARVLSPRRDGEWLSRQTFAPLVYLVPGLIHEGLILLAGSPKIGKSVIMLQFALAVASGGEVFGVKCDKAHVYYLALEDSDRRMQQRCWELLLGEKDIPENFTYRTDCEPGKVAEDIEEWLSDIPKGEHALVLIDTIAAASGPARPGETTYDRDYRITTALKNLTDFRPSVSFYVSSHARKAEADDFLNLVSGTNGISGGCDKVMVLSRKRGHAEGILRTTGRDDDDAEYALLLSRPEGWVLNGDSLEEAQHTAETSADARKSEWVGKILRLIDSKEETTRDEIITEVEDDNVSGNHVDVTLTRLVKNCSIKRVRRGVYGPIFKRAPRKER